jgi:hypothetical protein
VAGLNFHVGCLREDGATMSAELKHAADMTRLGQAVVDCGHERE